MSTKEQKERVELLQGTLDLLILRTLVLGPAHGHAIAKAIEFNSDDVLQVEQGSLYPALHRLIKRGWISVEGGTSENNRRAKFYRLTAKGRRQLAAETSKWDKFAGAIARILRPAKQEGRIMKRSKRMLEELDEDIREHIERETQDNIERGMTAEEARYAAMRKFGNVTRVKEETREVWSFVWLEQLLQDIRFGLRMLAQISWFCGGGDSHAGVGHWRKHSHFQLDRRGNAAVAAGRESIAVGLAEMGRAQCAKHSRLHDFRRLPHGPEAAALRIPQAARSPNRCFAK